jgi:homoserine kinase
MRTSGVTAFAPATVANLGPGFDVLGLAISGVGDTVTVFVTEEPGVRIRAIHGDGGVLPVDPTKNTAGIAAAQTIERAGVDCGVELVINKGMPIGSGLGSSAASAAAAAFAVNVAVGAPLRRLELVEACVEAEAAVAGRHADNVAPAILGGLVLVRGVDPLDVVRLPVPDGLYLAVVTPDFALPTKEARAALPVSVTLQQRTRNAADIATFVAACYSSDLPLIARSVRDDIVTPARSALIPGADAAMDAALGAGALASSISGAGPSIFALCHSERIAAAAAWAMRAAFLAAGLKSFSVVSAAECPGARIL